MFRFRLYIYALKNDDIELRNSSWKKMLEFFIQACKLEYVSEKTHKFVNGYKSLTYSLSHSLPPSLPQSFIHSSPCRGCFGDSDLPDVLLGFSDSAKVEGPVDPSCFMITGQCQLQVSNASIQIIGSLCSDCSILPFITLPYATLSYPQQRTKVSYPCTQLVAAVATSG